ncbi:30S ribosomal protein S14 [Tepidiforma flava]|jgi:small subunit ribosomal protein S14|uniref:Small ribosomal subunit protein uS14 n=1 Tax=Tepidiforma flava TaxID=3004094 RepID=A0ABY7M7Z4_9CHLR|nr:MULTISPECIES: 30S ribosomal protein S14 [Tepidiforma]MCX7618702.1 30S ribosomal protein S14 [Tepidiforma sp.]WBL36638.1 30S ribosomal protein S14 [Tepidiforma flava]GIW19365.1 MAG: 30S ribosomal protein S14 [Tepidiforma sp.]
MASKGIVNRDLRRRQLNEKYAGKRAAIKAELKKSWGDPKRVAELYDELRKLPLNSSPTRIHNRCLVTGRPKAYIRKFGLSRITFREYAHRGLLPGVTKSSW